MSDWGTTSKDERARQIASGFDKPRGNVLEWLRRVMGGGESGTGWEMPAGTGWDRRNPAGREVSDYGSAPLSGDRGKLDMINPFDDTDPTLEAGGRDIPYGYGNDVRSAPPETMGSAGGGGNSFFSASEPLQTREQRNDVNVREQSLQRYLSRLGYDVTDDGMAGPKTLGALNDFVKNFLGADVSFKPGDVIPPEVLQALEDAVSR